MKVNAMDEINEEKKNYRVGIVSALLCGILWGLMPIYWDSLKPIPASRIIIYRVALMPLMCYIPCIFTIGPIKVFKELIRAKKKIIIYLVAGILITLNWSTYIWAVNAGYVIQTCMGYFVEPLMVCAFGAVIYKEKLNSHKRIALIFAVAGLVVMIVGYRQLPVVALGLAATFSVYAALKKSYDIPAIQALFYETLLLLPVALVCIYYMEDKGIGVIGNYDTSLIALLMLSGLLTALPMGLFSFAAAKLPLITLGLTEYISPSIGLFLGIWYFSEPFDTIQFSAFSLIWIGLVFFTYGEIRDSKEM